MPHVDEAREEAAIQNALKNGTQDYSILLGPDWRNKFTALSEQLEEARRLKLPLSVFETVSGGAIEPLDKPQPAPDKTDKTKGK